MRFIFLFILCLPVLPSCEESLPPRRDPEHVFDISYYRVNPFTFEPIIEKDAFFEHVPDGLTFGFRVINTYDDPVEAPSYLVTNFIITPEQDPFATLLVRVVDTSGAALRFLPGKPRSFMYTWNLTLPYNPGVRKFWEILSGVNEGKYRRYDFTISGDIQIFRSVKSGTLPPFAFSIHLK